MARRSTTKRAGAGRRPKRAAKLRCGRGYTFERVGRNQIALMRNNQVGVTIDCSCSASGGCKITIDPQDPQTVSCLESGCTGSCGWVINVPGLAGVSFRAVAARS